MRKLHTELEIFHQPAIRNPFLLYFLLVLRIDHLFAHHGCLAGPVIDIYYAVCFGA